MSVTITDVNEVVAALDPRLQKAYKDAASIVVESGDTLDADWQIATTIEHCFWSYTRRIKS